MSRSVRENSSPPHAQPALIDRLRRRGWRLTPQRRAIAEALTGAHVHLTAEEIHARAAVLLPEVGRATVYNTLHELVGLGEVREVTLGAGPTRYDPAASLPHHHLVCAKCGATRDVYPENVDKLKLSPRDTTDFTATHAEIVFWGVCRACETPMIPAQN